MKMSSELIEKAKQAKFPEELIALAKENGAELSAEEAKTYFDRLHKGGELADEELDNVAGGCGDDGYRAEFCPRCKAELFIDVMHVGMGKVKRYYVCPDCHYSKEI